MEEEYSHEQLESFREHIHDQIDKVLGIVSSEDVAALSIDPISFGTSEEGETDLTIQQLTVFRKELYATLRLHVTQENTPFTTYNIGKDIPQGFSVRVFQCEYIDDETEESSTLYLHEAHFEDGHMNWVIALTSEDTGIYSPFSQPEIKVKSSSDETRVLTDGERKDVTKESASVYERATDIARQVQEAFPAYSQLLDNTFKKNGRICLYQESPDEEGRHPAINILATDSSLGYILGFVKEKGKKNVFRYKNLPKIFETKTKEGVKMEYPPTTWTFNEDDEDKKIRSFNEMVETLDLLREHGEF